MDSLRSSIQGGLCTEEQAHGLLIYTKTADRNVLGGLSLEGFLSKGFLIRYTSLVLKGTGKTLVLREIPEGEPRHGNRNTNSYQRKVEDLNNIFCRDVHAAQRPHLSIPETEAGKSQQAIPSTSEPFSHG